MLDWVRYLWPILDFFESHNGAVTAVATVAIGFFTYVLACVTGKQAKLTRDSIDLARDEFNSTHRPKIIVYGLKLDTVPPAEKGQIGVQFRWVNIGDTPAKITGTGTALVVLFKSTPPSEVTFKHKTLTPPVDIKSGEHGFGWTTDSFEPSDPILLQAMGGAPQLLCVGYVAYRDAGATTRQTGFCRQYDPLSNRWKRVEDDEYEYAY